MHLYSSWFPYCWTRENQEMHRNILNCLLLFLYIYKCATRIFAKHPPFDAGCVGWLIITLVAFKLHCFLNNIFTRWLYLAFGCNKLYYKKRYIHHSSLLQKQYEWYSKCHIYIYDQMLLSKNQTSSCISSFKYLYIY